MKFTKPALSFADLIQLMEDRGLKIEDRKWATPRLRKIGYYRLCAYARPLQVGGENAKDHTYKKESSFGLVLRLYEFDCKLRNLTFELIESIEVALRTHISDTMAATGGSHWFLDPKHFQAGTYHGELLDKLEEEFFDVAGVPKKKQASEFLEHYYQKYGDPKYPPSWMLTETLSFGTWSKIYQNLTDKMQKQIANYWSFDHQQFGSWLRAISVLRNVCAHHGRLWNRRLPSLRMTDEMKAAKVVDGRFAAHAAALETLVKTIMPAYRWGPRLSLLMGSYPEADPKAVGFPLNWDQDPFWRAIPPDPGCFI